MRARSIVWMLLLATWPCAARAADGVYIEQEVIREQAEGQPQLKGTQRIWVTETHLRNELTFGDHLTVAIFDLSANRILLIPGNEKQYVEMPLAEYRRLVAMRLAGTGLNESEPAPTLQKTEGSRKIGRWQCERWLYAQSGKLPIQSELWVTKDAGVPFSTWTRMMEQLGLKETLGRIGTLAAKIEGFPIEVKTEQTVLDRKLTSLTRVTRIDLGPVDPALFQVPADFEKLEVAPLPPEHEPDQAPVSP